MKKRVIFSLSSLVMVIVGVSCVIFVEVVDSRGITLSQKPSIEQITPDNKEGTRKDYRSFPEKQSPPQNIHLGSKFTAPELLFKKVERRDRRWALPADVADTPCAKGFIRRPDGECLEVPRLDDYIV